MQLRNELFFLEELLIDPAERYRSPSWLLSDFDSNVWLYSFNFKVPKELHWNVPLSNGTYLSAPENSSLLNSLKYFLTTSTCSALGDGDSMRSNEGKANYFNRAIHIVDYLLINDEALGLNHFGLSGISTNDLKSLLFKIANNADSAEAIYDWREKVVQFGFDLLAKTLSTELEQTVNELPAIAGITADDEDSFDFSFDISLVPLLRAAFFVHGFYRKSSEFGYTLNSVTLSKVMYPRTLRGKNEDKPTISIFAFNPLSKKSFRELPGVPVTDRDRETATTSSYGMYRQAIYNMGLLHEIGVSTPDIDVLRDIQSCIYPTEGCGRFKTVPSKIVFSCLKNAIEFHLKHGRMLLDAYLALAKKCLDLNLNIEDLDTSQFLSAIGKPARDFGIVQFCLSFNKSKAANYFIDLRANKGLSECLAVYLGAVQIVIGILTARRVGELKDLKANICLDQSRGWLVFKNRKSTRNLMGLRRAEARPIDPIAVEMIDEIVRFQEGLVSLGCLDDFTSLFAIPSFKGDINLTRVSSFSFNRNLDYFCDYFETGTNAQGQRFYVRQHQLRRFFALVFFRSSGFGGIDTLRWMLGHVDLQHTYHYITETVGGAVLRGAKAQAVAESFHEGAANEFNDLANLIEQKFKTRNFTIIDTDELTMYIESLMENGAVTVEPVFITNEFGEQVKIVVHVNGVDNCE